jgi:NAD(P)-dependent dehydrogenase (short-subunit alcohol dehydrogenase family)
MSSQPREGAGQVLLEFQSVMAQFLAIQREVLGTYLASTRQSLETFATSGPPSPAAGSLSTPPPTASELPVTSSVTSVEPTLAVKPSSAATEPPTSKDSTLLNESSAGAETPSLVRLAPRTISRPPRGVRAGLARDRAIVITDDGRGVADALSQRLRQEGYPVAIVRAAADDASQPSTYTGSLQSLTDADRLVESISSSCRGIAALIHLLPLAPIAEFERMTATDAWERLRLETVGLFLLAKASKASLHAAAADGGAAVFAVSAMGGAFGCSPAPIGRSSFPGQGGVVGFTKCLAIEWPEVRVRAVDTDPGDPAEVRAGHIFDELWVTDTAPEVGYLRGERLGLDLEYLAPAALHDFVIPSDAVILATGGARGITAETCLELASRYQPTFVLVGQTCLPDAVEPADTADLASPADLKRALMARLNRDGTRVTVAMVEKAYQQLLREREIRGNIGALTAAGARVHYVPLDIRDEEAFAAVIADIYATYGRLDGVIHGAGIIEDKLVQDKAVESFERVLATKTRSAFVLSRCVRPESLRFVVFFSSVAGRFGNRGQADYAAANEVLNKLALQLDRQWPTRVCSINWAPWDKRGMVSPELKREFMDRGVELIEPAAGRRAFWDEIQQPKTDPAEIVLAVSSRATLTPTAQVAEKLPLMKHATRRTAGSVVQYVRWLDPSFDLYLSDHCLDGRAVLPLAVAAEMMAEAAHATWPDLTVVAIRDLRLLKGVVIDDTPVSLMISVRPPVSTPELLMPVDVEISTPSLSPVARYRAVVELGSRAADRPTFEPFAEPLSSFPLGLADAYRSWTFHGPAFQRIVRLDGIGSEAIVGHVYSPSTRSGIREIARAEWVIDPFVFDCALQLLLMWSRARNDKTALPSRFKAFRRFDVLSDTPVRCYVSVESLADGYALRSDVHFVGPDGRVLGILEGMEASCTAALNRVAGH